MDELTESGEGAEFGVAESELGFSVRTQGRNDEEVEGGPV